MSSYAFMRFLESSPWRYDRGMRWLSGGRMGAIHERVASLAGAAPGRRVRIEAPEASILCGASRRRQPRVDYRGPGGFGAEGQRPVLRSRADRSRLGDVKGDSTMRFHPRLLPVVFLATPALAQTTVTLVAIDHDSITAAGDDYWNDNRLRAYNSPGSLDDLHGYMKFDMSSIPDAATISAMTLRTYHEAGFGNPHNDPQVAIWRSDDDTWSTPADDPYPGVNQQVTPIHGGAFPAGDLVPYDWPIDVSAADWSVDLADDLLSLAMRTDLTKYNYVYFYGAQPGSPAPPELIVTYDGQIGTNYCGPAIPNSSGLSAVIAAYGSDVAADNDVRLEATRTAVNQFGYFLNSMTTDFVMPPGSQGNLCLGGAIGRYKDDIKNTGPLGEMSLQLDLTNTPTPSGPVAIQSGETWFFQAWFRDKNPGNTSNFTDGVRISFL